MAKVLVAEDEEGVREFLVEALELAGHTVTPARDGHEAKRLLGERSFELLLTDLKMPGPSGLDLLREVKASQPELEVILLTAHGTVDTAVEAMKLGGVIYIAPFLFVLNPALVGQAPAWEVAVALVSALAGVWCIGSALQGFAPLVGELGSTLAGAVRRVLLFAAGLTLAMPGGGETGLSHGLLIAGGLALALAALASAGLRKTNA